MDILKVLLMVFLMFPTAILLVLGILGETLKLYIDKTLIEIEKKYKEAL